jgi:hypothetical protein
MFVNAVAHERMTPINSIINMSLILKEKMDKELDDLKLNSSFVSDKFKRSDLLKSFHSADRNQSYNSI